MQGTGVALVTPFDSEGAIDEARLRELVEWVEARGVDFIVPCGSTGEAAHMTIDERARVVEVVADAAAVPVLAGTGHSGVAPTVEQTNRAADAGADAALVVPPHYYPADQTTLARHYEAVAAAAELPVYAYNPPGYVEVVIEPRTVERLAAVEGIAGLKDSQGDLAAFERCRQLAPDFDLLVGHGGVYAHALEAGADGAILALANVAPEGAVAVADHHAAGEDQAAREANAELAPLNRAVTARFGIPGLKAAMAIRGAPAGAPRAPFEPVDAATRRELEAIVADAGLEVA